MPTRNGVVIMAKEAKRGFKMLKKTIAFSNGNKIPVIGLGTWQTPNDIASRVVKDAIDVGYIHIDTAAAYRNEEGVGEGIRQSGVDRRNLFITTKVPAEIKTYEGAKEVIQQSLKKLQLDYIDLVIIHCPAPWPLYAKGVKGYYQENVEVYRAMEEAVDRGEIKSIGVSNFAIDDIQNILDHCKIKPVINQIPWFIGCRNEKLKEFCKENGILVESYSPLGTGRLLNNPAVIDMAKKYNVTVPQLCIKFALMDVDITLPKTTHKEYMIQNAQLNFEIAPEDFEALKRL